MKKLQNKYLNKEECEFGVFSIRKVLQNSLSIQKIAYMAVFIAASVAVVLIFNTFVPLMIIQSFRVAFAGIFVKIAGLILGPIIGGLSGLLTDLFILILRPADYHPGYTLTLILFGTVAGLTLFLRESIRKLKNRNILFYITVILLILVAVASSFAFIDFAPDTLMLFNVSFLRFELAQVIALIVGSIVVFLTITLFLKNWYKTKPEKLNDLLVIIVMNVIIDFVISQPLISFFDGYSAVSGVPFLTVYMTRLGTTTITVLWNTLLIYVIWRILQPIVWRRIYN